LLKDQGRPADFFHFEIVDDFDAVGYCNKGNVLIHPEVLAVEEHCPLNLGALLCSSTVRTNVNFSDFVTPCIVKSPSTSKVNGAGLRNLCGVEGDERVVLHIEIVFALHRFVFQAASGVHAVCLNLDVQNGCRNIGDVNVRVASHLSKVPATGMEDLTKNLKELSSFDIAATGTSCAWAHQCEHPGSHDAEDSESNAGEGERLRHEIPPWGAGRLSNCGLLSG
jgi:hypothetical protein